MKHKALWERIESVEFADPKASLDFIHRLMRENQWTNAFALSAVFEYKRYAYLAMVCDHEVTPSDEVDQVWHLHLQYSRHYWGKWTAMLGGELHHGPTCGGLAEAQRFNENYARTLASYEREFEEIPPPELWPDASIRFSRPQRMVRMNPELYPWKPRNWTTLALWMKIVAIILLVVYAFSVLKDKTGESLLFTMIFVPAVGYVILAWLFGVIDSLCGVEPRNGGRGGNGGSTGSGGGGDASRNDTDGGSGCGGGCGGGG